MLATKNNKAHVRMSITILKQFGIVLDKQQKEEIYKLPTEIAVDRYKKALIKEVLK